MSYGTLPLRPYQRQALDAIGEAKERGIGRQLIVLPTGSGKTVCFAHLVGENQGRALVLAHRDELISQAADKLRMVSPSLDIGIVKAQQNDTGAQVVVGSVQTLSRPGRLEQLGKFSTVIVDEAHHAVAASYLKILDGLGCMNGSGPLTVGFTATAGRSDKVGLGHVWQEITYRRGIIQMIAEGHLCDVSALQIGTDFDLARVQTRAGDYTDASISAELERSDTLDAAAEAYRRYAKERLGVAFTPTIATAHALAAKLAAKGIPAEPVDGEMPLDQRRTVLGRLHRGETRVVCNCAVLTEGWDEPAVSCALLLRPTKSAPFFVQMAGRILRPYLGSVTTKDDALILDLASSADLGLATIADLAGLPPGSVGKGQSLLDAAEAHASFEKQKAAVAAARTRQVELLRRSDLHWIEASGTWVLPAGADQTMILVPKGDDQWEVWRSPKHQPPVLESGNPLSLDWARGVGEEVARAQGGVLSQADAAWRKKPVTDRQADTLTRMGYADKLKGLTRGGAADLLTIHFAAKTVRKLRRAS
jgi:superfamily II DNA or RNA helicase